MTQQQLNENIQALQNQGASQSEIQSYISSVKIDKKQNIFQKVGGAIISSEKNFSDSLSQGILAKTSIGKSIEDSNAKLIKSGNDLIKLAQTKTDLSAKQKLLDLAKKNFEQAGVNWKEVLPSVEKTNKQVLGEAAGVGLDLLTAGSFGNASKVPTVLKPLQTSIKQGFKRGALQGAKVGVPLGAAYGATNAMQEGSNVATGATVGAVAGGATGALISGIVGGVSAKLAAKTTVELQKAKNAVNKVLLGTKEDIKIGLKELGQLETKGVKTFDDLLTSVNTKIEYLSGRVDEKLSQNTNLYKLSDLVRETKVGNKTVKYNYVNDALNGLQEMYTKIVSPDDAERIAQLIVKANNEGLTIQEVNNIAREFGTAFKNKAFSSRTGEQLTSLSGQAFESIRSGVKATLREFTDETTKLLDQQTSRLMRIRSLVTKNAESANKLAQRMEKSGLINNIIRRFGLAVSTARDVYARAFYKPSATDVKLDILQIEKQLYKNLQFLRKLEKSGDKGIFNWLEKTINKSSNLFSDLKNNKGGYARIPGSKDNVKLPKGNGATTPKTALGGKYKTTVNIQDKNDLAYLKQIFSEDTINDIKSGKKTNWRGESFEDIAKINIVSEVPKTAEQQLAGKIKDVKLKSNTFYHGTNSENASGIMKSGFKSGRELPEDIFRGGGYGKMQSGISFAETPKEASIFSTLSRDGKIVEAKLKDGARVVSIDGIEDAVDLEDYIQYLKKQKIDAVYIGGGEKELVVINPKVITPVKPKLPTPKLTGLEQEARKYKSAEEFVKAQGKPILHGTQEKFGKFDTSKLGTNEKDLAARNAFFFTDSLDTAKSYGDNVMEAYGNFKKPITIDADGKMYGDMREIINEAVLKAKKDGNDVVIIKNLSDRKDWGNYEPATHYAVIDTNKLQTKSQLIDIWNKANKYKFPKKK